MKLIQLSPEGVIHIQPKHTGRTLCGDTRGWATHITTSAAPTCQWCRESLEDLVSALALA